MILLASSAAATLAHWEQCLQGIDVVVSVRSIVALEECVARIAPSVLVLDVELSATSAPKWLVSLRNASPSTKMIALTRFTYDEQELALFRAGVCGCCRADIDPELARRAVTAVEKGELWIRRSIIPRLLNELAARLREETATLDGADKGLTDLTAREREIAQLIGNGESNKEIARHLLITERTVKAHVSGIFRKLGIGDRLSLALRVSAYREDSGERVN